MSSNRNNQLSGLVSRFQIQFPTNKNWHTRKNECSAVHHIEVHVNICLLERLIIQVHIAVTKLTLSPIKGNHIFWAIDLIIPTSSNLLRNTHRNQQSKTRVVQKFSLKNN